MTDSEDDVRAARDGDRAALDRLLGALWPRAFRLALGITQHAPTAEDAAQDALVLVATRLESLRDPRAYPAWSTRLAVNAATSAVRRRPAHLELDERAAAAGFEGLTLGAPAPTIRFRLALARRRLAAALGPCAPAHQEIA